MSLRTRIIFWIVRKFSDWQEEEDNEGQILFYTGIHSDEVEDP